MPEEITTRSQAIYGMAGGSLNAEAVIVRR
jgi:hypothetical protein